MKGTNITPTLGLQACVRLGLLKRVHEIIESQEDFFNMNKDIFQGLGCFPCKIEIKLKTNYVAVAKPPRRIPLAIKERVKESLLNSERNKIIVKVHTSVEWVNNLTVVEKPDKSLRICLDPKFLNEAIIKPYHHIPTIEEISAKLVGSKYFSVFDLKDGFYQCELTDTNQLIYVLSAAFLEHIDLRECRLV